MALYVALKGVNKNAMLVAMGLAVAWAIIDVGVTEFNSLTLISLAQNYNAATDSASKAAYLAASDYALSAIPIATFYSYAVGSVAFLMAAIVMLKGVFRKFVGLVGITANLLGIVSAFVLFYPDLSGLILPTLNLYGFWNVLVGVQLIRIGRRRPS